MKSLGFINFVKDFNISKNYFQFVSSTFDSKKSKKNGKSKIYFQFVSSTFDNKKCKTVWKSFDDSIGANHQMKFIIFSWMNNEKT